MSQLPISPTLREFLLEIYQISEGTGHSPDHLAISDINQMMSASPAALNRAILRLKEMGLLDHQPYHGIRLTDAGRREALPWIRRFRIAKVFLNQIMGLEWHEIHDEAKQMIGGMNDAVTQRMLELTGFPTTCPHGEPIPHADGTVAEPQDQVMHTAPIKTPLVISRVLAREPERLKYIAALRLIPGTILQVIHVAPFDGPLQLKLHDDYRIIGHNLAQVIYVRPQTTR